MEKNFNRMTPTELKNFQQAMKDAQKEEDRLARNAQYRTHENKRRADYKTSTLSVLNAKPVDAKAIKILEDNLIQSVREFKIKSPLMGKMEIESRKVRIAEEAKKVDQMHRDRAHYESAQTVINEAPSVSIDVYGESTDLINNVISKAYNRRDEASMPQFDTKNIVKSLNQVGSLPFDAEAPSDWEPSE